MKVLRKCLKRFKFSRPSGFLPFRNPAQKLCISQRTWGVDNEHVLQARPYYQKRFFQRFDEDENDEEEETSSGRFLWLPDNFKEMSYEERKAFVADFLENYPNLGRDLSQELRRFYDSNPDENQYEMFWISLYVSSRLLGFAPWIIVGLILAGVFLSRYVKKRTGNVISFNQFEKLVQRGVITRLVVHSNAVEVHVSGSEKKKMILYSDPKQFEVKLKDLYSPAPTENKGEEGEGSTTASRSPGKLPKIEYVYSKLFYDAKKVPSMEENVVLVGTILVFVAGLIYLQRMRMRALMEAAGGGEGAGGGLMEILPKTFDMVERPSVTFDDVAGLSNAKTEILEYVSFIKDFEKYSDIGCKVPRGCLLSGPPGCGKTLLARALAGECGVPFFSLSGSDFVEMIVGIGPQRVRNLFEEAREHEPSIVFIDEIDAVGSQRGHGQFLGRNDERENTLNQLLIEMDGFPPNSNVVVLAATNRAGILDTALLRPGRFDRKISIGAPSTKERKELFEIHLRGIKIMDEEIDCEMLAKMTPGLTGADIAAICNEAALLASRDECKFVELKHFEMAVDRTIVGLERRSETFADLEREIIAFHEAGHAVTGWLLPHAHPVLKVTIVPRSAGVLGFTLQIPDTETTSLTREQLLDRMCVVLGGRIAEKMMFGHLSTGARNDLEVVTQLAYAMVTEYGMSEKVGRRSFHRNPTVLEIENPYSEATAEVIDEEVKKLIDEMYERTWKLLKENEKKLKKVTKALLENETLTAKDIIKLIGDPENKGKEFNDFVEL